MYMMKARTRVCAKWQWNTLDWRYWIALPASLVVQSSNTVSCVSLSFCTHQCVLAIKPHANIEYWRCGGIKELYSMRRICAGKVFFFNRHLIPSVLAILLDIFCIWGWQLRFSSIVNPRKFNWRTFLSFSKLIFLWGTIFSMFLWWRW